MIRVAISGATGQMGKTLIKKVLNSDDLSLTAAFEHSQSAYLGEDAAILIDNKPCGVPICSSPKGCDFDVLIDFTRPKASLEYLDICKHQSQSMVIGTTGFDDLQLLDVKQASQSIPIMMAPNMSIGVNLSFKLIAIAAKALADEADIEIIEAHHKHKVDAPSGTALAMGQVIAQATGRNFEEVAVFERHGSTDQRKQQQIGFSVIRAGDIIGEHTSLFALDGERIEITHKASNRAIYAKGALHAVRWLHAKSTAGLFNMQNVLGLA